MEERLKEHRRMVASMSETSEIAKHVMETGHRMDWANAKILDRETKYGRRIFKEAWWTKQLESDNRTKCVIGGAWTPLMDSDRRWKVFHRDGHG